MSQIWRQFYFEIHYFDWRISCSFPEFQVFFYFLMLIGALFFWESHIWCEQIILYQRSINYFLCCFFRKNDLSPNIQKIVNKWLHLKIHFVTLHLILIDPGWLNESKNSQIFSQCSKKFFVLLRVKSCFTLTLAL